MTQSREVSVFVSERRERRGTLPIFLSDVKARHDKMVVLVERMLKLHVKNGTLTADGLCGAEFPAGTDCR